MGLANVIKSCETDMTVEKEVLKRKICCAEPII